MRSNMKLLDEVKWNVDNLVAVIAQDSQNKRVLMMAWMNKQALLETIKTKRAVYWSRSRQKLWIKGESSGFEQIVESIHLDCDGDTILISIRQVGGIACHTGRNSCFYRRHEGDHWIEDEPVLKSPKDIYS